MTRPSGVCVDPAGLMVAFGVAVLMMLLLFAGVAVGPDCCRRRRVDRAAVLAVSETSDPRWGCGRQGEQSYDVGDLGLGGGEGVAQGGECVSQSDGVAGECDDVGGAALLRLDDAFLLEDLLGLADRVEPRYLVVGSGVRRCRAVRRG
jgi:hypothetical protein